MKQWIKDEIRDLKKKQRKGQRYIGNPNKLINERLKELKKVIVFDKMLARTPDHPFNSFL